MQGKKIEMQVTSIDPNFAGRVGGADIFNAKMDDACKKCGTHLQGKNSLKFGSITVHDSNGFGDMRTLDINWARYCEPCAGKIAKVCNAELRKGDLVL